jgi:hypothetical protein
VKNSVPVVVLIFSLMVTGAALAADRDFQALVSAFETRHGASATSIPLMGLVKFFVKAANPSGVKQLNLAVFESGKLSSECADDFDRLVRQAVGERWKRIVSVKSRRSGEGVHIYLQDMKKDFRLLVATFEDGEATFVEVKASAEQLMKWLDEPLNAGSVSDR